jgi:hypothetical protein
LETYFSSTLPNFKKRKTGKQRKKGIILKNLKRLLLTDLSYLWNICVKNTELKERQI